MPVALIVCGELNVIRVSENEAVVGLTIAVTLLAATDIDWVWPCPVALRESECVADLPASDSERVTDEVPDASTVAALLLSLAVGVPPLSVAVGEIVTVRVQEGDSTSDPYEGTSVSPALLTSVPLQLELFISESPMGESEEVDDSERSCCDADTDQDEVFCVRLG